MPGETPGPPEGAGTRLCCPCQDGQNGNPGQLYLSFNNAKLKENANSFVDERAFYPARFLWTGGLRQEATKESFYQQIGQAVIRLEEYRSLCVPGRDWSVEQNVTIGTGFFVRDRLPGTANKGANRFFLVTARHVVENRADIFARVATGESGHDEAVLLLPRELWVFHPEPNPEGTLPIDVAVMRVEPRDFIKTFLHCTEEENPEGAGEREHR